MFLTVTSTRSETPTIVDTARLTRFCPVLIDGGPGWIDRKRTYAINDPFQLYPYVRACATGCD